MSYCTVPDVQALRPQHPITTTSKPNQAQVEQMIENLSSQVDGRICAVGILLPVTGPESLRYLKSAVAFGVAGLIEDSQRAGIAGDNHGGSQVRSNLYSIYQQMIDAVVLTPAILCDAANDPDVGAGGNPPIESFFTNNPTDDVTAGMRGRLTGPAIPRFEIRKEF